MDYKKVIEDFASGKIDREKWALVIDNDGGYWDYKGDDHLPDEEFDEQCSKRDRLIKEMAETYGDPEGYQDVVDILNAAGVPAEWC